MSIVSSENKYSNPDSVLGISIKSKKRQILENDYLSKVVTRDSKLTENNKLKPRSTIENTGKFITADPQLTKIYLFFKTSSSVKLILIIFPSLTCLQS